MSSSVRLGEALGAAVAGHVVFSTFAMARAAAATPPAAPERGSAPEPATSLVVADMYAGRGVAASACTDDVSFTDPAAACLGRSEVAEAFRALGAACRPEHVVAPVAVASAPGVSEYYLHQRYFRGAALLPKGLEVRSVLVVRTDADGRICAFEERWNGLPLLWWSPFRWGRRINGALSSLLTPLVAR